VVLTLHAPETEEFGLGHLAATDLNNKEHSVTNITHDGDGTL